MKTLAPEAFWSPERDDVYRSRTIPHDPFKNAGKRMRELDPKGEDARDLLLSVRRKFRTQ